MGLFDKESDFEKLIKTSSVNHKIDEKDLYCYFGDINDVGVYTQILNIMNNNFSNNTYYRKELKFITGTLYPLIVNSKDDLQSFYNLIVIYFNNYDLFSESILTNVSLSFDNKSIVVEIIKYLSNKISYDKLDNIEELTKYLPVAREYFVDDRALASSFYSLINTMGNDIIIFGKANEVKRAVQKKIREDKKANGIYDLDEAALKEMDRKIESLDIASTKLKTLLELARSVSNNIKNAINGVSEKCADIRLEELKKLKDEAEIIIDKFNASYLELLNKEKESIRIDKETIIKEIYDEVEKRRNSILEVAESVSQTVDVQLGRIDSASKKSITQIEDYMSNNENVRKVISEVKNDGDLLEKIAYVQKLNNPGDLDNGIISAMTTNNIILANNLEDKEIDYTVNQYFNSAEKFKERFKRLKEIKAKMEEKGEIFHEKFDDVLTMIIEGETPYLWGPSGSGKTYMIEEQIAKILELEIIKDGYIKFEHEVLGFNAAGNGIYVPSNFYRAFSYGSGIFYDEFDNSDPSSAKVLNRFLKRRGDMSYTFPNGKKVERHPNFRIITAGNTKGTGRTEEYNTCQKQDESILQRLKPIYISYDNSIEMRVLKDYPEWLEFAVCFRNAIEKYNEGEEENTIGTFTTRDAESVWNYLNDQAFSEDKIIEYEFIENKEDDYLVGILNNMESIKFKNKDSQELLKVFKKKVEMRKVL